MADLSSKPRSGLELAHFFHETYERLAPDFGYETRQDTREFSPSSRNGQLMAAVCTEVLNLLGPSVETEAPLAAGEGGIHDSTRKEQQGLDVAVSVIVDILRIRGRTERRLLAVTSACRADHAYVSAKRSWQYINALLEEGFTKGRIASELGISKTRVTAVTAHRVARLYRKYTS